MSTLQLPPWYVIGALGLLAAAAGILVGTVYVDHREARPSDMTDLSGRDVPSVCAGVALLVDDSGLATGPVLEATCVSVPTPPGDVCERIGGVIVGIRADFRHIETTYHDTAERAATLRQVEALYYQVGYLRARQCRPPAPEWHTFESPIIAGGIDLPPAVLDARAKPPER